MKKRQRQNVPAPAMDEFDLSLRGHKPITARTPKQKNYLRALRESRMVLGVGPAGTGKTYLAACYAIEELVAKRVERVIVTRATVPIEGEEIGFLPGSLEMKMAPWLAEIMSCFEERVGKQAVIRLMKEGMIQIVPFAFMRGRTFKNAIVLADEIQNATPSQVKALVTRIGEDSKMFINGDPDQSDLRNPYAIMNEETGEVIDGPQPGNGLVELVKMIRTLHLPVPVVEFNANEVVRDPMCAMWVKAYKDMEGVGRLRLVS